MLHKNLTKTNQTIAQPNRLPTTLFVCRYWKSLKMNAALVLFGVNKFGRLFAVNRLASIAHGLYCMCVFVCDHFWRKLSIAQYGNIQRWKCFRYLMVSCARVAFVCIVTNKRINQQSQQINRPFIFCAIRWIVQILVHGESMCTMCLTLPLFIFQLISAHFSDDVLFTKSRAKNADERTKQEEQTDGEICKHFRIALDF